MFALVWKFFIYLIKFVFELKFEQLYNFTEKIIYNYKLAYETLSFWI